jgi:hypothetical protein
MSQAQCRTALSPVCGRYESWEEICENMESGLQQRAIAASHTVLFRSGRDDIFVRAAGTQQGAGSADHGQDQY